MIERIKLPLVTVGGLGLAKKAPGTWGSVPPALVCFALLALHVNHTTYIITTVVVFTLACVACVALTPWSERRFNRADPRQMVLDEVAGQSLAALAAPAIAFQSAPAAGLFIALSFALFRVFDIAKPGLIDTAQRLPGGWGVLLDDLLAGAAALGILLVAWRWFT